MQYCVLIDPPIHGAGLHANDKSHGLAGADRRGRNVFRKRFEIRNRFEGLLAYWEIDVGHHGLCRAVRIQRWTEGGPVRQLELIGLTDEGLLPRT